MTSVNLSDIGYMSTHEIANRKAEIRRLAGAGIQIYPSWGFTPWRCDCGKTHEAKKEWGKHPHKTASHHLATTDTWVLETFWDSYPSANPSANPKKSGMCVVDFDPRNQGHISYELLREQGMFDDSKSWKTLTGSYDIGEEVAERGIHLWFRVPEQGSLPANLNELGFPGVDIKYNGGVLVPPSRHPLGGGYEWAPSQAPWELDCQDMPKDFLDLILTAKTVHGTYDIVVGIDGPPKNADSIVEKILESSLQDGERNTGLYKLTCRLAFWMGCYTPKQQDEVRRVAQQFNQTNVFPPLDHRDNFEEQIDRAIRFVRQRLLSE